MSKLRAWAGSVRKALPAAVVACAVAASLAGPAETLGAERRTDPAAVADFLARTRDPDQRFDAVAAFVSSAYGIELQKPYEYDDTMFEVHSGLVILHCNSRYDRAVNETLVVGVADGAAGQPAGTRLLVRQGNFENIRHRADAGGTRHVVLADTLTNIGTGILEKSRIVVPASSGALMAPMMFPVLEEYANWFMPKSGDVTFQAEETVSFLDHTLRLTIGVTASKAQGGRVSRKSLKPLEFHYFPDAGFRQTRGPALQERLMETYGTFWPEAFKAPPLVNLPPPKPAP